MSAYSHLVAAVVALVASIPLVKLARGRRGHVFALSVYVACVTVALAISGVYHSLPHGDSARLLMQRLDYYAIWLLIAGTFTAVHGIMCRGFWRGGLLAIIWTYALLGVALQTLWWDTFSGPPGLALYLGHGWIGIASVVKLGRDLGFRRVLPVLYAGASFSAGAILDACDWPVVIAGWVEPHEVFHAAVVVGVALMWLFIRDLLLRHVPPRVP